MANVKMGFSQISKPTPASINTGVRVFTVVDGIFMGWMQTNNLIGAHAQAAISSILGLLLAIANGLAPLFGIDITTPTVRTEDVTAIKDETKN